LNRYIRWPSDWDTIVTNIEKLKSITDHLSVNITATIINVTRLYELVSFLETVLPSPATILINEVTYGPYVPFNFPDRELAIEKISLLKNTHSYAHEEIFKNKVDYFISVFENSHSDKAQLKEFFKFNDLLDNHRGVYLKDIVPELEKFRHE
jgi:sulfatase maturation enzyme AslB (radical SAM superfamily)